MKSAPRVVLCDVVRRYGRDVVAHPQRVRGLLNDLCPDCRPENELLVHAQQLEVPTRLRNLGAHLSMAVVIPEISVLLERHFYLPEAARWAVETWALALGFEVPGSHRRISRADGKEQVWIPEGEFLYGEERLPVTLPGYWIDVTPVTQGEYQRFLQANPDDPVPFRDKPPSEPYNWDQEHRTPPPGKERHPVVLVSWHDAVAYVEWAGKRLPTEEEWEKAARGTDGREYPWGNTWDPAKCNTAEGKAGGTTPVGRYSPHGDSPYGCVDMAGNVWEWTASDWDAVHRWKVVRGGFWFISGSQHARAAFRYSGRPNYRDDFFMGFRGVEDK